MSDRTIAWLFSAKELAAENGHGDDAELLASIIARLEAADAMADAGITDDGVAFRAYQAARATHQRKP